MEEAEYSSEYSRSRQEPPGIDVSPNGPIARMHSKGVADLQLVLASSLRTLGACQRPC